jgi:alpha-beta hydrolase superfamily lysophospholipase
MKNRVAWAVGVIAVSLLALRVARPFLLRYAQSRFLTTKPNGAETPATLGLPFERLTIASGGRHLDGFLVQAPRDSRPGVAVLLFHGAGETISDWVKAQRFLYEHGISSMVFDYSGHGDSSRPGTIANLQEDGSAAYEYFLSRFSAAERRCVMGHSMGNGVMLKTLAGSRTAPSGVVMANAFSSLRDEMAQWGTPRMLTRLIPDVWNNVQNVAGLPGPLLVLQSDADPGTPIAMGQKIFDAASGQKQMVVLHNFEHNALYRDPTEAWWKPAVQFMHGSKP